MKQLEGKREISRRTGVLQRVVAFTHLVELETVNRPLAASALGFVYFIEISKVVFSPFQFFGGLLSIVLVLCYVMSINDCFDVEDDKVKSKFTKKKIVVSVEISVRDALLLSITMLLLGLVISWFVSEFSFFVALLIVILSTLYSVPPIRYKQRFPFSTLGEFVGSFLPFLFGCAILGPIDYRALVVAPIFALTSIFWRFFHEGLFRDIDLKTGKRTFAVVYGLRAAKALRRVCLLFAVSETLILFFLGWFSFEFFILLGLYYLFSFGFWYYLSNFTPKLVHNAMGPTWGAIFVSIVVLFLIF